ncbi:MAG: hypothetical protein GEU94_21790 [Micromonosporaceae bacterium]|nr:hypothetical protein [Micromonosporaceae bacterium]
MGHCSGYSAVSRNYVGLYEYELRHRTSYNSDGTGIHGGRHSEHFNSTFLGSCDNWIKNLNFFSSNYGGRNVAWVGDVGVGVCKPGMHGQARAFDLTQLRFTNGSFIDMNYSWRSSRTLAHKRGYVAVAAQCRRYAGTVLTAWYNSAHQNHIHFDNGTAVTYIRTGVKTDTTLVQASCNFLNGESLAVDGIWGSLTEAAYQRLLGRFNMRCTNPKGNRSDAVVFLSYIVRHGLANRAAGTYRHNC